MERHAWMTTALLAAVMVAFPAAAGAALDCDARVERRVERYETLLARDIARCERNALRRGTSCPDARLEKRADRRAARMARSLARRCPDADLAPRLASVREALFCSAFDLCPGSPVGTMIVRVTNEAPANGARNAGATRMLDVDAGFTGFSHNLQILEGAGYEAEFGICDATAQPTCYFSGATNGTPFGAPSPILAGGIPICVTIDFASDLTGTFNPVAGGMSQNAVVSVGVTTGRHALAPCPFCQTIGTPALGDPGTCDGGTSHGAPCVVDGLADIGFGAARATSLDCLPDTGREVARFTVDGSATTGVLAVDTSAASPSCRASGFSNTKCLCDTCDDAAGTPCMSDADCPAVGGGPGTCGGARCFGGPDDGLPCQGPGPFGCTGGVCLTPGEPTKANTCTDLVCTPTADGGRCMNGPFIGLCSVATNRPCSLDIDCPIPGEHCEFQEQHCFPDPITLEGSPGPLVGNVATPTLVGVSCLGAASSSAVNAAAGLPGPVSYVWPTEVTFAE